MTGISSGTALRVAVVSGRSNPQYAEMLKEYLRRAGVDVCEHDDPHLDGSVVLLSESALDDHVWHEEVGRIGAEQRLVPVLLGPTNPQRLPPVVAAIQWIALDPGAPDRTWAVSLAALSSEPATHALWRTVRDRHEQWERGGRSRRLLMTDASRTRELDEMLQPLIARGAIHRNDPLVTYVAASRRAVTARRLAGAGVVAAVLAITGVFALVALLVIPAARLQGRNNRTAIATMGLRGTDAQPEWSSLVAGALLINGTPDQRTLAREALVHNLSRPWTTDFYDVGRGRSIEAVRPLDRDTSLLVLGVGEATELALYRHGEQRIMWTEPLGGFYWNVEATPDGVDAVVVGGAGIARINLETREVTSLSERRFDHVAISSDGDIGVATWKGRYGTVDLDSGVVNQTGSSVGVLDLVATDDGGLRAVLETEDGYALVDVQSGALVAAAATELPVLVAGAAVPDEAAAVVVGSDRQLHRLDASGLTPTGIGLAPRTLVVRALGHGRVVLGGLSEPNRAVHLPTGATLGPVCRSAIGLQLVRSSRDRSLVACVAPVNNALWTVPSGPVKEDPSVRLSRRLRDEAGGTIVRSSATVDVVAEIEGRGSSYLQDVTEDEIVAVAVAAEGDRVLVATDGREAIVVALEGPHPGRVATWSAPDGSPIAAVGWNDDTPVVRTAAGDLWAANDCPGCGSDEGLVRQLDRRLWRCWSDRQLAWLDESTRDALGVETCGEEYVFLP